jgi:hypothetical protein
MNWFEKHNWHSKTESEIFEILESNPNGLNDLEVAKR